MRRSRLAPPRRHYCRCGSSVFARSGDEIEVHLGGPDASDQLTPTYECRTIRRKARLPEFPLERRYERDRIELAAKTEGAPPTWRPFCPRTCRP